MPRPAPIADVREESYLQDGVYLFQIVEIPETSTNDGRLMYGVELEVLEPTEAAGALHTENCTIGTLEDKDAVDPNTWLNPRNFGAKTLRRILSRAAVPLDSGDMELITADAAGHQVVGVIVTKVDDGSRGEQYKGRIRSNVARWYTPGEIALGLSPNGATAPAPAPAPARAPVARAAAPAAPPPVATPAPRRAAPAPAPKTAPAAAAPPPAPRRAAPKVAETLECALCQPAQQIPRDQYSAHIALHEEQDGS